MIVYFSGMRVILLLPFLGFGLHFNGQIILDSLQLNLVDWSNIMMQPWDVESIGEDTLLVTHRESGQIVKHDLVQNTQLMVYNVSDLAAEVQGGLMGMAVHPDFPEVNSIYIVNTHYNEEFMVLVRIQELTYNFGTNELDYVQDVVSDILGAQSNIGGRLMIGSDEKLYLTMGELDDNQLAQDENGPHGKILRYNLDGTIPADNPIAGNPMYTLGHRNPQGICEGLDGSLYISEHGAFTNDEVNMLEAGRNYGWPLTSGPCNEGNQATCDEINMMEPMAWWTPNIAPGGLAYFNHETVPTWQNSLLLAVMKGESLIQLQLDESGEEIVEQNVFLENEIGRIRDIEITENGRIFLITSNTDLFGSPDEFDDHLYELVPTPYNYIGESSLDPRVWYDGQQLRVSGMKGGYVWEIHGMDGRWIARGENIPDKTFVSVPEMVAGLVIFTVRQNGYIHSTKIHIPAHE